MASVSISHFILFIASLVVAAGVAGTLTTGVDRLGSAIDDESDSVTEAIRTDVEVISDSGSPVYDLDGDGNVTLYVKNTGTRNLPVDGTGLDVLVNGEYAPEVSVSTTATGHEKWNTGDVVEVEIAGFDLADGEDHRVKLIVGGDEEVFVFRT
jgi:flagellar protein FlaG